jgi:hypothetical protein
LQDIAKYCQDFDDAILPSIAKHCQVLPRFCRNNIAEYCQDFDETILPNIAKLLCDCPKLLDYWNPRTTSVSIAPETILDVDHKRYAKSATDNKRCFNVCFALFIVLFCWGIAGNGL